MLRLIVCLLIATLAAGAQAQSRPKRVDSGVADPASVLYASLFKKSPVGLKYTAGLDEGTARFLQGVAWETVQDYYKLQP